MSNNDNTNIIPISIKGRKKLLTPLNINKSTTSISTKDSNISQEEINIDNDKKLDLIFLSKLSEREKTFFEVKATDIYNFLKDINLLRYIESFINDGFETKEDLMEIREDYFQENKNFNKNQQKKILNKVQELLNSNNNNINNNTNNSINIKKETIICDKNEMGVGNNDINEYNKINIINRCWTCFNKLNEKNFIEIKYNDSMINKKVRFCSEKCKNKFEINIYKICDNCNIKYDKSKGEYIFDDKHFHSQKCLDEYLNKNKYYKDNNNNIIEEENYENNIMDNNEDMYDPMNDF